MDQIGDIARIIFLIGLGIIILCVALLFLGLLWTIAVYCLWFAYILSPLWFFICVGVVAFSTGTSQITGTVFALIFLGFLITLLVWGYGDRNPIMKFFSGM